VGRVGVEFYFTGTQRLADDPFRARSVADPYFGALAERKLGRVRLFVNSEKPVEPAPDEIRPARAARRRFDGRWTVDAWAPLDGFVVNAGFRVGF